MHRLVCFRRHFPLRNVRIVLAFAQKEYPACFGQVVDESEVDVHYDHILCVDACCVEELTQRKSMPYEREVYVSGRGQEKEAPAGLITTIDLTCLDEITYCINKWFSSKEVYWRT